jgi:hypothetical protein
MFLDQEMLVNKAHCIPIGSLRATTKELRPVILRSFACFPVNLNAHSSDD